MSFRKQKGNMYDWVTHTWNAIKGKCAHDCVYCYMKIWGELKPLRFDEKEMKRDLGIGNTIFVGSSTDMFAENVPKEWIERVIRHCIEYPGNTYIFQSKNPERMSEFQFPDKSIVGTTIESNRDYPNISNAPGVSLRAKGIVGLHFKGIETFVTIEPILDFDLDDLLDLIKSANPKWVNVGADSKGHNLPEPNYSKVLNLVDGLGSFTEIRKKSNLDRLKKR